MDHVSVVFNSQINTEYHMMDSFSSNDFIINDFIKLIYKILNNMLIYLVIVHLFYGKQNTTKIVFSLQKQKHTEMQLRK